MLFWSNSDLSSRALQSIRISDMIQMIIDEKFENETPNKSLMTNQSDNQSMQYHINSHKNMNCFARLKGVGLKTVNSESTKYFQFYFKRFECYEILKEWMIKQRHDNNRSNPFDLVQSWRWFWISTALLTLILNANPNK